MTAEVGIRDVRLPEDRDFVRGVYATTRIDELAPLSWPQPALDAFITMQFEAQSRHYSLAFPDAISSVVTVGDVPAGRLIVNRATSEIRIVDLALLPRWRRMGVGRQLVSRLVDEADNARLPLRCHVEQSNDAIGFWRRMGLVPCGVDGTYVALERACPVP
jgi:ribosomal protein S18 acetylase RimI-like enzyme